MKYHFGVDIGSTSVKVALINDEDAIVALDHQKITLNTESTVQSLINRLETNFDLSLISSAGVSGSGKDLIPVDKGWVEHSSSLCIAAAVNHFHPEVKTIIEIGGQSSLVLELEDGLKRPWQVVSNPLCAAGTGRFIEQQAYRLGISMDDFSNIALRCEGEPPRIAARCSVFAKTDLIHLQQKGVSVEAMLYALCESISRMVISLKKGQFLEPIVLVGGVAANTAVAKAIGEAISMRNLRKVEVVIPPNYLYLDALGAALLSMGNVCDQVKFTENAQKESYYRLPKLEDTRNILVTHDFKIDRSCNAYLGVDVGSTSTKAVIIDENNKVLAKSYLMTAGRPVDAVKQVFKNLIEDGASKVKILGAGVTGSGRYLVGGFIGADLIKNEITAQTRAASEIDPEADIIEIGGQDSKLVIKRKGTVIDYQMNKACAAGTGSFIDELAEMLGVSVTNGDFARIAFDAPYTIDLGTRCAAFMSQAVSSAQQSGVPIGVISASLATSIVKNYLSKVVGNRKLGKKVILTGAVFYNEAIVSSFRKQLEGKTFIVPEHKEISGAIGAALLSKEVSIEKTSTFKGFQEVINDSCQLSAFTCKVCDNNCAITKMLVTGDKPAFYGSRCDLFDSTFNQSKMTTSFDDREKILFQAYSPESGSGQSVGVPRSLLVYDYAPLILGFLNALDLKVILSSKTNREIIEESVALSYSDSCFPLKLLYGHVAGLKKADFILSLCGIRLGSEDGQENQKYSCPLVQASPFIVSQALDLKERMLIPIIDLSKGNEETIDNLANIAMRFGFDLKRGKEAARSGIMAQRKFEEQRAELGSQLLKQLHEQNKLGVVIFSRSYMSQDSGANLGIAEKLAKLGVVPIPLDFLPLDSINPKTYSDRPYWFYESRLIAGAAITAQDPQLYGLMLTNFGCGPNSFITKVVEDIIGDKPLGQLEIDEHAAEAGIVTRLEAFVDTISGYSRNRQYYIPADSFVRRSSPDISSQKTLLLPQMCQHAEVLAAAMEACGARAIVLPEADERNVLYSSQITSGTECLPFRVCLGDFIKFCRENENQLDEFEGFMAGSYGPCRLGKYSVEQMRLLKEIGYDLKILTTVSNSAYRDLNLGQNFERLAWKGIVAMDYLQRLLWRTRPYEKIPGTADALFSEYTSKISAAIRNKGNIKGVLRSALHDFKASANSGVPRKPLVGINGEIFLRLNRFSNRNLVRMCEKAGLEVTVSSMGEWFKYTSYRNLEDAVKDKNLKRILGSFIRKSVLESDERSLTSLNGNYLGENEPSTSHLLELSGHYLSPRCGSEAILSIGSGIEWMESPHFAGVISVMPHGCMPGGIVAAMSEKFAGMYHKPWVNLTFDGFIENNNLSKINNLAEVIKFCSR
jgi:predicted CoA-substrate-specific enzyme activase